MDQEPIPDTYVQNREVAEQMAYVEKPFREQMAFVEQLGLSPENMEKLTKETDAWTRAKAEHYEKAIPVAETLLMRLISNRDKQVDFEEEIKKAQTEGYSNELRDAIAYKTEIKDPEGNIQPKIFEIGGIKLKIVREESPVAGHKIRIEEVKNI